MILFSFLVLTLGAYAFVLMACAWTWYRLPRSAKAPENQKAFFTVIIPVKDEVANILNLLQDLERQTYPASSFEVIVIDDHSTDGTAEVVRNFSSRSTLNLTLLFLASFPENRLKKGAIALGVSQAKGDWIASTDGDCRLPITWLASLNQCRVEQKAKFISGPVSLVANESWFERIQALEFSALIGVGAASIGMGAPTMCNGANLAYEKDAFQAVDGFTGNAHVPSGDDEFLMHKVHQAFKGQVAFLKQREAMVSTKAVPSLGSFIEQRKRWASKWKHYTSGMSQGLAVLVLMANLALWFGLLGAVAGELSWAWFGWFVFLKLMPDALLLWQVLGFFQKRNSLLLLGLLQVVYVSYILTTAILGWRGTYAWKDRQHVAS